MRRYMFIAAFAFFLAVPLWAQRGGHAGSGGHFSGGHVSGGHSAGFASHGFSGGRVGPSHSQPDAPDFAVPSTPAVA